MFANPGHTAAASYRGHAILCAPLSCSRADVNLGDGQLAAAGCMDKGSIGSTCELGCAAGWAEAKGSRVTGVCKARASGGTAYAGQYVVCTKAICPAPALGSIGLRVNAHENSCDGLGAAAVRPKAHAL